MRRILMEQKNNKTIQNIQPNNTISIPDTKHFSINNSIHKKGTHKSNNPSTLVSSHQPIIDHVQVIQDNDPVILSSSKLHHCLMPSNHPPQMTKSQRDIVEDDDPTLSRKTLHTRTRTNKTNRIILVPTEIFQFLEYKLSGDSGSSEYNIPLFAHLTTASIHQLYQSSSKKKYNIRNIVYNIGQQVQFVYMIISGEFKVSQTAKNNHYTLTKGSFFGFEDLINGGTRRNQIICVSAEGVLIEFKKEAYEACCVNHVQTYEQFKQIHLQRQAKTRKQIKGETSAQTSFGGLQKMFQQMSTNQQKKNMLRSNKVFKNIDKQYKMIYTLTKFDKKGEDKDMAPKPWFKNADRKMKMRIKQMENRVGISKDKEVKRVTTPHSLARRLLTQLNYNPNTLKPLS